MTPYATRNELAAIAARTPIVKQAPQMVSEAEARQDKWNSLFLKLTKENQSKK